MGKHLRAITRDASLPADCALFVSQHEFLNLPGGSLGQFGYEAEFPRYFEVRQMLTAELV